jgi:hypothetical protein
MSSLITNSFATSLAQDFIDSLDINTNTYLPSSMRSYFYVSLGRKLPWSDGVSEVVPTPTQSIRNLVAVFDRGIVARRVTRENASFVIPRIDWESGTVYAVAGCTTCPIGSNFYVKNSKDQVFKCLDNNESSQSTSEPQLVLSSTSLEEPYFLTEDGYKWKYMYTLTPTQKQKFLTDNWMPANYNKFVRASAVNRSIDIVRVTNSGNNYVEGTSQDIITVVGDGQNAILKANVSSEGQVVDIIVQDRGLNYTRANLVFQDVPGGIGSGAEGYVILSPQNGHGFDPVEELYANTIMFSVDFDGTESDVFPADNDFREISLIKNPFSYGTTDYATSDLYTLYTKIKVSPGVGDFNNDEIVFQGIDYENSTFSAEVISFDETTNVLYLNNVTGTLQTNQPLKGFSSGSIRVAINRTSPTMEMYSGKILYISDIAPITRDVDQTDRIRFILSF